VTVTATASKYKKTGQGRELRQLREQTETRTGWRMMNATDKQREINSRDRVKDQYLHHIKKPMNLKMMTFWMKQFLKQQCHIYHCTKLSQELHKQHGKTEDMIQQETLV
ncbi:MAG: hypothetical protein EZS28_053464, partial [Streblomastix strix]